MPPFGPFFPLSSAPPAEPQQGKRTRYVVVTVERGETVLERGRPTETEWHVTLRRAAEQASPLFLLRVVQHPDAAAPYRADTLIEMDQRLVEKVG